MRIFNSKDHLFFDLDQRPFDVHQLGFGAIGAQAREGASVMNAWVNTDPHVDDHPHEPICVRPKLYT